MKILARSFDFHWRSMTATQSTTNAHRVVIGSNQCSLHMISRRLVDTYLWRGLHTISTRCQRVLTHICIFLKENESDEVLDLLVSCWLWRLPPPMHFPSSLSSPPKHPRMIFSCMMPKQRKQTIMPAAMNSILNVSFAQMRFRRSVNWPMVASRRVVLVQIYTAWAKRDTFRSEKNSLKRE